MWVPRQIEFHPAVMDMTSAGLGRHATTEVYADRVQVINALDLLDVTDGSVQLLVCGHCGQPGCASGNWVDIRRYGRGIVLLPCFSRMEEDVRGTDGYGPPGFITEAGGAYLTGSALAVLASRIPVFGELGRWPAITGKEWVRLMQWSAPARMLGEFPEPPRLRREMIVAVDPLDQQEAIVTLETLVAAAFRSGGPITPEVGDPVSFYLNLPGIAEWGPLAMTGNRPLLALAPDFVASVI